MNQQVKDCAMTLAAEVGKTAMVGAQKGFACARKVAEKGKSMICAGFRKSSLERARPVTGAIFCVGLGLALVSGVLYLFGRRK